MQGGDDLMLRLVEATERNANASEALITLAKEEREQPEPVIETPGLPVCPHCGTFNPTIRNEGGSGPFAEFALLAACDNCGNRFIAAPRGWDVFKDADAYRRAGEDD